METMGVSLAAESEISLRSKWEKPLEDTGESIARAGRWPLPRRAGGDKAQQFLWGALFPEMACYAARRVP